MRYRLAAPDLSGNELAYVSECVRSTWVSSLGPFVSEFEARVAEFAGARHAISTCNGTVALHLALSALGIGPDDEVIVPSLTYVASANAVRYCGATPVFADVDPQTWCIAPASVERLLTPRTRAILPVHLYGQPCDMEALGAIARSHQLGVVEDAAEALGAQHGGRPVGALGDVGTFSFFGNKIVTTGEGGMVLTNDDLLAQRLRLLRNQGMDTGRRYWHPVLGYNYRMTNVAAALGVAQMERVGQFLADRRQIADWYHERLRGVERLVLPREAPGTRHVFWLYSLLVAQAQERDALMEGLAERGVETRPFFYPIHQFPMYRDCRSDAGCPVACDVASRGISLPSSSYLKEGDVEFIAAQLADLVGDLARARAA
jgi:perosamine synthetase